MPTKKRKPRRKSTPEEKLARSVRAKWKGYRVFADTRITIVDKLEMLNEVYGVGLCPAMTAHNMCLRRELSYPPTGRELREWYEDWCLDVNEVIAEHECIPGQWKELLCDVGYLLHYVDPREWRSITRGYRKKKLSKLLWKGVREESKLNREAGPSDILTRGDVDESES